MKTIKTDILWKTRHIMEPFVGLFLMRKLVNRYKQC